MSGLTAMYVEFDIHRDYWMNANDRDHWTKRRAQTEYLRTLAKAEFQNARHKFATPVHILARICIPTNRRFDPPNAAPTVKALIDGIVDAGVIPDDDHEHVPRVSFERGPKTGKPKTYRVALSLTPIGEPQ